MIIFSYIWPGKQALKNLREINSKAKSFVDNLEDFNLYYGRLFTFAEFSKPEPLMDIEFNDYEDLEFAQYKDVHISQIEVYETANTICGFEVYYIVDGEVVEYCMHYKTKK